MKAKLKNLVECILIKVDVQKSEYHKTDEQMSGHMRDSDYMGMLPDGNLYVLLTNTTLPKACSTSMMLHCIFCSVRVTTSIWIMLACIST